MAGMQLGMVATRGGTCSGPRRRWPSDWRTHHPCSRAATCGADAGRGCALRMGGLKAVEDALVGQGYASPGRATQSGGCVGQRWPAARVGSPDQQGRAGQGAATGRSLLGGRGVRQLAARGGRALTTSAARVAADRGSASGCGQQGAREHAPVPPRGCGTGPGQGAAPGCETSVRHPRPLRCAPVQARAGAVPCRAVRAVRSSGGQQAACVPDAFTRLRCGACCRTRTPALAHVHTGRKQARRAGTRPVCPACSHCHWASVSRRPRTAARTHQRSPDPLAPPSPLKHTPRLRRAADRGPYMPAHRISRHNPPAP